ncbi:hypothetical protein CASFOL_016138 [Castilleja foliolosa]|uniref:KIB1-4 beta-propeller domain-containing protein n=1 Tax=Castilleja foliolosa TaxID=1961234 RepID=A0ABD3DJY0_9LAMI
MSASIGQATKSKSEILVVCHLCSQPGHRKAYCPLKPQRQCQKPIESEENRKRKLPFLLTLQRGTNAKQSFCRPLESRSQTIYFPDLVDNVILASNYGWLVLVGCFLNDHECCLWNPGSKAMIKLPNINRFYLFNKCVLSKPPTEPDCHILFYSPRFCWQSYCKIGDVKYVEEKFQLIATASFQGKIYGFMNPGYKFVTIEFVGGTMEFRPLLILDQEQPLKAPVIKRNWVVWHEIELMESPFVDELLLVIKDFTHHNYNYYATDSSEYRVFRVDINRMKCIEVDDIGDHVILISKYGDEICCSSSVTDTFKPNSIYHTEYGAYVYVYDLDDKSMTSWLPPDVAKIDLSNNFWLDLKELIQ